MHGVGYYPLTRGETWSDAVLSAAKARSRARARPKRKWKVGYMAAVPSARV